MSKPSEFDSNRREFLTGRTIQKEVERTGQAIAEELLKEEPRQAPVGGNTIRMSTDAMACEFSVVLNQGASADLMTATDALEIIHQLEAQMTVYRDDSELSLSTGPLMNSPCRWNRGCLNCSSKPNKSARTRAGHLIPRPGR